MYKITEKHDLSDVNFKGMESYRGGARGPNAGEWGHFRVPKGRVGEVLQQNGGIWNVFKVSFNFHGQNLMNIQKSKPTLTLKDITQRCLREDEEGEPCKTIDMTSVMAQPCTVYIPSIR
jgi:hypothetical protein